MHKSFAFLREPKSDDKKNIIFLDIDGVIQSYSSDERFEHELEKLPQYFANKYNDPNFLKCDIYDLGAAYFDWDEVALAMIKHILREFDAYLVIHSGWRESVSYNCLKALFKLYDMDDYILDVLETGKKEDVIKKYLKDYEEMIEKYVVIDDNSMIADFGLNFCHTYNLFYLQDQLYVNRLFFNKYCLNDNLEFFKNDKLIATINKEVRIFDNKTVNIFKIQQNSYLDEYEVLMIDQELKKYCANNDVWCMCLSFTEDEKEMYSLIPKEATVNNENNYYVLSSPKENFMHEKEIRDNKNKIVSEE